MITSHAQVGYLQCMAGLWIFDLGVINLEGGFDVHSFPPMLYSHRGVSPSTDKLCHSTAQSCWLWPVLLH